MKFLETFVLLPCHSLDDFPSYQQGVEAEGLLAAWTAPWHPRLIACCAALPQWARADAPPYDLENRLIVVPAVSQSLLPEGFAKRVKQQGGLSLRNHTTVEEIVRLAIESLREDDGHPEDFAGNNESELVDDFHAFGYALLMSELLTRHMRATSNIDMAVIARDVVPAAEAAVRGELEQARTLLARGFDLLYQARKYFYPVDTYLIDLTLVAATAAGKGLIAELQNGVPTNALVSGATLTELAATEPHTLEALRLAAATDLATVVGGEQNEIEAPLVPLEANLRNLRQGLATYERLLGVRPRIFGRRRYGLSPLLPNLLSRLGFEAALHFTLDDGHFPQPNQCRTRWEGVDGSSIEALSRLPLDASKPATYLSFARQMADAMDRDHVATVVFVHWPGQACYWHGLLRRAQRFEPALGHFVTLAKYFERTDSGGRLVSLSPDDYRAPYLKQAVIRSQPDPISSIARQHMRAAESLASETLQLFNDALLEEKHRSPTSSSERGEPLAARMQELAALLPRKPGLIEPAVLLVNTLGGSRRMESAIAKIAGDDNASVAKLDPPAILEEVPGLGFHQSVVADRAKHKPGKPLAEALLLRNEFMEARFNGTTGALTAIHDYKSRGNRLSTQIAMRQPGRAPGSGDAYRDPDETAVYSVMAADAIEVTSAGPLAGEMVTQGRLLDLEGQTLARFRQRVRLPRGSRVLTIDVDLEIDQEPRADPWNSYYAFRFAWSDAEAELWRSVGHGRHATTAKRIESPHFVEVEDRAGRMTLLSGGLPYHRYSLRKTLDTLLVVRGESCRQFRLGIGVNLASSAAAAAELLTPGLSLLETHRPRLASSSGWLFQISSRNVLATHWQAIYDPSPAYEEKVEQESESKPMISAITGFRVRLVETAGVGGVVTLRSLRPVVRARGVDYMGATLQTLAVQGDKIEIHVAAYEWNEIEADWR